jgi:hypothetical protein
MTIFRLTIAIPDSLFIFYEDNKARSVPGSGKKALRGERGEGSDKSGHSFKEYPILVGKMGF